MEKNQNNQQARMVAKKTTTTTTYSVDEDVRKLLLQETLVKCWERAIEDPDNTRIIIELNYNVTYGNGWEDVAYVMIDASDGQKRYPNGKWWMISSDCKLDFYVNPSEILPKALEYINGGQATKIYNDTY